MDDANGVRHERARTQVDEVDSGLRGRVHLRFAEDGDGELYVLTKSDGMIGQVARLK